MLWLTREKPNPPHQTENSELAALLKADRREITHLLGQIQVVSNIGLIRIAEGLREFRQGNFRVINPDNQKLKTSTPLKLVGFCATRKDIVAPEADDESREITEQLITHLPPDVRIYCYNLKPPDKWTNLVLLEDSGSAPQILDSRIHKHAVLDLSPRLYSDVRIHRGELPKGLWWLADLRFTSATHLAYSDNQLVSRNVIDNP